MSDDPKFEILGPLLEDIGRQIFEDIGEDPDGVFLYAEAGDGWVERSVFKDKGSYVQYYPSSMELCDLLIEAWEIEPPDKRWAVMMYEIRDGRFDVTFRFPEEVNPDESSFERSESVLRQRYGDKRIEYPPIPDN